MKNLGITHVQIIGVDNVLVKIGDPYFLGYAETKNYDVTCKFVTKVTNLSECKALIQLFSNRQTQLSRLAYSPSETESHMRSDTPNENSASKKMQVGSLNTMQ